MRQPGIKEAGVGKACWHFINKHWTVREILKLIFPPLPPASSGHEASGSKLCYSTSEWKGSGPEALGKGRLWESSMALGSHRSLPL